MVRIISVCVLLLYKYKVKYSSGCKMCMDRMNKYLVVRLLLVGHQIKFPTAVQIERRDNDYVTEMC